MDASDFSLASEHLLINTKLPNQQLWQLKRAPPAANRSFPPQISARPKFGFDYLIRE
ncbi:MAG: hypothetical protein AB1649_13195 [Chloroflexota bacterium]